TIVLSVMHAAICLCYQCSQINPVQHSFPTRRSSDLHCRASTAGPARGAASDETIATTKATRCTGGCSHDRSGRRHPDDRLHHRRDRKSTRLNSSHVKISYAVFCLKKKKKILSTYKLY